MRSADNGDAKNQTWLHLVFAMIGSSSPDTKHNVHDARINAVTMMLFEHSHSHSDATTIVARRFST